MMKLRSMCDCILQAAGSKGTLQRILSGRKIGVTGQGDWSVRPLPHAQRLHIFDLHGTMGQGYHTPKSMG